MTPRIVVGLVCPSTLGREALTFVVTVTGGSIAICVLVRLIVYLGIARSGTKSFTHS